MEIACRLSGLSPLPTPPPPLVLGLDSDLATRLSLELACLRGPPASILWNRSCPPPSHCHHQGLVRDGVALELKIGMAFVEG